MLERDDKGSFSLVAGAIIKHIFGKWLTCNVIRMHTDIDID